MNRDKNLLREVEGHGPEKLQRTGDAYARCYYQRDTRMISNGDKSPHTLRIEYRRFFI